MKSLPTFTIVGRITNKKTGFGVPGLRIEAWDKDMLWNDLVGSSITDQKGTYQIKFDTSYFKEGFLDKLGIFFKIFQGNNLIKVTDDSIRWDVKPGINEISEISIELELNYPTEKPLAVGLSYIVTSTDSGTWLHAAGSDFLFAFLDNNWNEDVKKIVTAAFQGALKMSSNIKDAVKRTTGQEVVNGLYLFNQTAMTEAMNSIEGMGETSVEQKSDSGEGLAIEINQQFFTSVLAGLGGDVAPLMNYITQEMSNVQAQTKKEGVINNFGTVIGLVSLMPVLNVPITTFQYVYSSEKTSSWFVSVNCGSTEKYSYDYSYTVVNYNYAPTLE